MKSNIHDRRRVNLEKISSRDYIPFLTGRPKRQEAINYNDILNLKIALHTTRDVNELPGLV